MTTNLDNAKHLAELVEALEAFLCLSTPADLREDPDLHAVTKRARAALAKVQA